MIKYSTLKLVSFDHQKIFDLYPELEKELEKFFKAADSVYLPSKESMVVNLIVSNFPDRLWTKAYNEMESKAKIEVLLGCLYYEYSESYDRIVPKVDLMKTELIDDDDENIVNEPAFKLLDFKLLIINRPNMKEELLIYQSAALIEIEEISLQLLMLAIEQKKISLARLVSDSHEMATNRLVNFLSHMLIDIDVYDKTMFFNAFSILSMQNKLNFFGNVQQSGDIANFFKYYNVSSFAVEGQFATITLSKSSEYEALNIPESFQIGTNEFTKMAAFTKFASFNNSQVIKDILSAIVALGSPDKLVLSSSIVEFVKTDDELADKLSSWASGSELNFSFDLRKEILSNRPVASIFLENWVEFHLDKRMETLLDLKHDYQFDKFFALTRIDIDECVYELQQVSFGNRFIHQFKAFFKYWIRKSVSDSINIAPKLISDTLEAKFGLNA